jgi:iron-sulfur cluster repair protein YtfE (RIC family)
MVRPRSLELFELIDVLLKEHEDIKKDLLDLKDAVDKKDYAKVNEIIIKFNQYLNQHIIDEEATLLKVLLNRYGREGSQDAIRVFQQHIRIHQLIDEIKSLLDSSPELINIKREELANLLFEHFGKEEDYVFPLVKRAYKESFGRS